MNTTFAYIGPLNQGGTCLMRGEMLTRLLPDKQAFFINTLQQMPAFNRVFQSVGFRYKRGPLIARVNKHISEEIKQFPYYDFIWVDKAIYLNEKTTALLKSKTDKLIHYTPDTAFYANRSRHFYKSLPLYDYVVTTKWFDRDEYLKFIPQEKLIRCTQGYNPAVHKPYYTFEEKKYDVGFIGLCELSREKTLQSLINNNISVVLAGHGWQNFITKNPDNHYLHYKGTSLKNEDYARTISASYFSPGLLSKKFPERHTTRTFEIPACGTALLTERNDETASFFTEEEAIFYESAEAMVEKISYYKHHLTELQALTEKGRQRVVQDGRDYGIVLRGVLKEVGISPD